MSFLMNSQRYLPPIPVWTTNSSITTAMNSFDISAVASNGNTLIAVSGSNARAARSTDGGLTWSNLTSLVASSGNNRFFRGIAYGGGKWVTGAFNSSNSTWNGVYSTDDGVTWNAISNLQTANPLKIRYLNGNFVISGASDQNSYSTDGITFNSNVVSGGGYNMADVAYGNSLYVYIGQSGSVLYGSSLTSLTRTLSAFPFPGYARSMNGIAFGNGIFITVGRNTNSSTAEAWSSTNGTTWTELTNFATVFGSANVPVTITFDGAKFLVGGGNGIACSSTNGTTWTNESTLTTAMGNININDFVANSPNLIMAVGDTGKGARFAP